MNELPLPVTGIPIKPFGIAKQRLHRRLDAAARSALGRRIASRTVAIARAAGADVWVVTADSAVASWARRQGVGVLVESPGPGLGLNRAAAAVMDYAGRRNRPWLVLHADLPLLAPTDVTAVLEPMAAGRAVISPSHDGGTAAVGAAHPVAVDYGPGSFHRHLRILQGAQVVIRPGLAFDLDTVADLDALISSEAGAWLRDAIAAIDSAP